MPDSLFLIFIASASVKRIVTPKPVHQIVRYITAELIIIFRGPVDVDDIQFVAEPIEIKFWLVL